MLKSFCIILLNLICVGVLAQQRHIDSLKHLLKKEKNDSIILQLYVQLSNDCDETEIPLYAEPAVKLAQKLLTGTKRSTASTKLFLNHLGSAYNDLGFYNRLKGNTNLALELYNKTLSIRVQCKDTVGVVMALNNIGAIHYRQGQVKMALNAYNRCLSLQQMIKDTISEALTLTSMGLIYCNQGLKEKTLYYFTRSLNISNMVGDKRGAARALLNLGGMYRQLNTLDSALFYYRACVKVEEEIGDKDFIPNALYGIATVYYAENKTDSAIAVFNKCLKVVEYLEDKQNFAFIYTALANTYYDLRDYKKAETFASKSLKIAKEVGYPNEIKNAAGILYKVYKIQNKPIEALQTYELFVQMRDSVLNIETRSASIKSELKFEFDKKFLADSLENLHQQNISNTKIALQNAELKQASTLRWVLVVGLILVGLFVLFFYNRYKLTQSQKNIIQKQQKLTEIQKQEIEHKNKLITQSINYAKRIQDAFIQSEIILNESGKDYFVLSTPKDIVSGDFLWAKRLNEKLLFAVADCTGHGVPGAFMSLVSYSLLEQAVDVFDCIEPKAILENINLNLQKALKTEGNTKSYEGMDILLCHLDLKSNKLTFAGSKQRLYHLRNNVITEFRTDTIEIGRSTDKNFNQFELQLERNDVVYLFTDGFPDQKGGPDKTKLYYEPLKEYLYLNDSNPLESKKLFLSKQMENWKGTEEQVDDMLVFGLRV